MTKPRRPHVPTWIDVKATTASRGLSLQAIEDAQQKRDTADRRRRIAKLIASHLAAFIVGVLAAAWFIFHILL